MQPNNERLDTMAKALHDARWVVDEVLGAQEGDATLSEGQRLTMTMQRTQMMSMMLGQLLMMPVGALCLSCSEKRQLTCAECGHSIGISSIPSNLAPPPGLRIYSCTKPECITTLATRGENHGEIMCGVCDFPMEEKENG